MNVAVIGGGLTGLTLALDLGREGHDLTLFEAAPQLGGLSTYQDYGDFVWDRFYHVILPSDRELIGLIRDLGLGGRLRWRQTLTGLYLDKEFFSLSNNAEFLRFPKLGPVDKARLAATLLYASRVSNWRRLENVSCADWLIKIGGRNNFEKLWRPLLLAKLGEQYRRVSAVFIWSYIKRLFSARDGGAQREQLGYVEGGYRTVFDEFARQIRGGGGALRVGVAVDRIEPAPGRGVTVRSGGAATRFDKVIFTGPAPALRRVVDPRLASVEDRGSVDYLGVVCMALVSERPLVPYYVTNIADPEVPFTGLIGMSNLLDADQTAGLHLSYLPQYVPSDDPLLTRPDEQLRERFFTGLGRLLPDFDRGSVRSATIHRAARVQPLQTLGYSRRVPKIDARHQDFYIVNTAQFVNNTLNNNEVVKLARDFLRRRRDQFQPVAERQRAPAGRRAGLAPAGVAAGDH